MLRRVSDVTAERIFNAILGFCFVFYLIRAIGLGRGADTADLLGAGGFPEVLGVLALLVLLRITVHGIREGRTAGPGPVSGPAERRMLGVHVGLLVGYIVLLNVLGFAVSTVLYLFLAPTAFGYCRWKTLTAFAVVGAVLLVGLFGTVFFVPLPRGMGLFRELSYLVY